jgi:hypothetical protein
MVLQLVLPQSGRMESHKLMSRLNCRRVQSNHQLEPPANRIRKALPKPESLLEVPTFHQRRYKQDPSITLCLLPIALLMICRDELIVKSVMKLEEILIIGIGIVDDFGFLPANVIPEVALGDFVQAF